MKVRNTLMLVVVLLIAIGQTSYAQKNEEYTIQNYDKSKMPKYVVLTAEKGDLIFGSVVQVERRRSEMKAELRWLERYLRKNKASRNVTDLLNTMDRLSFDFVDFVESSSNSIGLGAGEDLDVTGTSGKNRILFVFKRRDE